VSFAIEERPRSAMFADQRSVPRRYVISSTPGFALT